MANKGFLLDLRLDLFMTFLRDSSSNLLLGGYFLLLLGLAVVITATGSDAAARTLLILIPFSGVVLGVTSAVGAESNLGLGFAVVLTLSGAVATMLAVTGGNPFSNRIVDAALIGSVGGIKFNQTLQTAVQAAHRAAS